MQRRDRTQLLVMSALLLFSTGLAIGSRSTLGFVVGAPSDLMDAPRWSNVPGSLVGDGVRGLGGGLEYAIAEGFCSSLIPVFLDDPKPTCEQLKEIIKRAFDKWAAGHPILRFVDVTGKIKPALPPARRDPARGYGAEIDFFAEHIRGFAGWAQWYYRRDFRPIGTNGKELPGHTITNADIFVNPSWCFFIDPVWQGQRRGGLPCNHFETLVMHEIGHTLGLHHPWQFYLLNYDSDDDPTNEIPIDCEDPTKGLKLSPNAAPFAIMGGIDPKDRDPTRVAPQLMNDDIGGRNFLYPICPSAPADAVSAGWARGQARPVAGD